MKLSRSCYAVQGLYFIPPWSVNAGIVSGDTSTLVIDTGSNSYSAETIYGYAQAIASDNNVLVVNTEKHLDHIGGNSFFAAKDIPIYGHRDIYRSPELIREYRKDFGRYVDNPLRKSLHEENILLANTTVKNPDHKIDSAMSLDLGGVRADIILTPGHTSSNISVFIPSEGVMYSGDCIVSGFVPNLEEGSIEDWKLWKKSLAKIMNLAPDIIVPGHGPVILTRDKQVSEIERIMKIIDSAIESGKAPTLLRDIS